jgi:hypothetical protein
MTIVKLEEVTLYTDSVFDNAAENIKAEAFFERCGVPHRRVCFGDKEHAKNVLDELNQGYSRYDKNFVPLTKLPLLQYVEVHDDIPARLSPVKFLEGLTRIQEFPSLYFSIENQ